VFTRENVSTIPDLSSSSFPDMDDIQINVNGVAQLLCNLDPQKATGPDNIPTRFLKMFAMELAPCLTLLYQASLEQGIVPLDWKKPLLFPFTRREIVHHQKTIVQYLLHVSSAKHLSISSQLISTHILIDITSLLTINMALEVEDHVKLN